MVTVVGNGVGTQAGKAARAVVAAYLNAAWFGSGFPATESQIASDWAAAVAVHTDAAFKAVADQYNPLDAGSCQIP